MTSSMQTGAQSPKLIPYLLKISVSAEELRQATALWRRNRPAMGFQHSAVKWLFVIGTPVAGACAVGLALYVLVPRQHDEDMATAARAMHEREIEPLLSGWPHRPFRARPRT